MEGLSKRNRKRVCLSSAGESQDHPADWFPGAAGLPKGGHMVLRRLSSDVCVKSRLLCPWDFPGKNTRVGSSPFSRGTSRSRDQTRVSCVSCSGRQILVPWSHLGSPDTMNELRHVQHNKMKWVRWEKNFHRILGVRMLCQDNVTASKCCMYGGSWQGTSVTEQTHVWLSVLGTASGYRSRMTPCILHCSYNRKLPSTPPQQN